MDFAYVGWGVALWLLAVAVAVGCARLAGPRP